MLFVKHLVNQHLSYAIEIYQLVGLMFVLLYLLSLFIVNTDKCKMWDFLQLITSNVLINGKCSAWLSRAALDGDGFIEAVIMF